ncbi:PucR family transcriptional regulator [Paenibacillus arenosi]|uniref:PucR family transcriptional regulator n=1 Tax=Paenibacillus arenosi TaxID=2774142 RepID=A0ABR9AXC0_9BACL|nr:helix-turn-helix domain-containing protein [Paenibacillus arenosi]MBD8497857.1 PucR family transcriptional regulator [Paenibacillus arenosi]
MNVHLDPFDRDFESIEAIADTISQILQCPVTIEDSNHRLLAYSTHAPDTDPVRIATIIGRRVPEHVISMLWREGIIQQIMDSQVPVLIDPIDSIGLNRRIAVAIRHHHDILGYIWVMDEHKGIDEQGLDDLNKASHAARSKLLQVQTQRRRREEQSFEFFWGMLTGSMDSEHRIVDRAHQLGITLPKSYRVMIIEFDTLLNEKLYEQVLYTILTAQRHRKVLHVRQEQRLLVLIDATDDDIDGHIAAWILLMERMQQRFGVKPVHLASGLSYSLYMDVVKSYQEAITVMNMKKHLPDETKHLHRYEELGWYRFLPAMIQERRARPMQHSSLSRLKAYDKEHQSGLVSTLSLFLQADCNVKRAAEMLHIHSNTLMYRLKRITDIGGIDLNDMEQKISLYLELKMDQWQS